MIEKAMDNKAIHLSRNPIIGGIPDKERINKNNLIIAL